MAGESREQFLASYDEYADSLFRFAYLLTQNAETAFLLTQDAFIQLLECFRRGGSIRNYRASLYTIAHFLITRASATPPCRGIRSRVSTPVTNCFARFSPERRAILALCVVDDLSPRQASRLLKRSEKEMSSEIKQTSEALDRFIEKRGGDEFGNFLEKARALRLHPAQKAVFRGRLLTLLDGAPEEVGSRKPISFAKLFVNLFS